MSEKFASSPPEFAKLFGKELTWAYRLIKARKVSTLPDEYGNKMIPAFVAKFRYSFAAMQNF